MSFYKESLYEEQGGFVSMLEYWWSKKSIDIRSSVPAKVLSIDYEKSSVKVQPVIKVFKDRNKTLLLPEVEVPLVIISAKNGKSGITVPVAVGDIGVLTYADQDTSDWLSGDGKNIIDEPSATASRENLSTGSSMYPLSFEVGIFTKQAPMPIDPVNVVVFNEKAFSVYHPDGKIEHKNANGYSVIEANGDHYYTNGKCVMSMTGSITEINNGVSAIMQIGGETLVNGCTITPTGNVITASGADLDILKALVDSHVHSGGTLPNGNTGGIV